MFNSNELMAYNKYKVAPKYKRTFNGFWHWNRTILFDSKKEFERFVYLIKLESFTDDVRNLQIQPKFNISIPPQPNEFYVADFFYYDKNNKPIVEDVKGFKTSIYKSKKKKFLAIYPDLEFREIWMNKKDNYLAINHLSKVNRKRVFSLLSFFMFSTLIYKILAIFRGKKHDLNSLFKKKWNFL